MKDLRGVQMNRHVNIRAVFRSRGRWTGYMSTAYGWRLCRIPVRPDWRRPRWLERVKANQSAAIDA